MSTSLANHESEDISVFRKVKYLVYQCFLKKNICKEILGFPVVLIEYPFGGNTARPPFGTLLVWAEASRRG